MFLLLIVGSGVVSFVLVSVKIVFGIFIFIGYGNLIIIGIFVFGVIIGIGIGNVFFGGVSLVFSGIFSGGFFKESGLFGGFI